MNFDTTITIPFDATAEALVAEAETAFEGADILLTYFNDDAITIIRHDLELVKGETLEVFTHEFNQDWMIQEGRDLQQAQGCDGNAAAVLIWVSETKKRGLGWVVSIANTDDRLFRDGDNLRVPFFCRDTQFYAFYLGDAYDEWGTELVLVTFRAIRVP